MQKLTLNIKKKKLKKKEEMKFIFKGHGITNVIALSLTRGFKFDF